MPNALDAYLVRQYQMVGLTPPGFIQKPQRLLNPQTADLPAPAALDQLFMQQAQRKREGEESLGSAVLKPLSYLFDALSAGEYGVASSIRAIIKQSRGESTTDPFTAFFRGVAAGFNSDEEYQTRMYDILTELGWDPETTSGVIGKNVLGFALGVALDPISYIGLGPLNRALRIDRTVAQAAIEGKNLPAKLLQRLGRGQWLSKKHGKSLWKRISKYRYFDELAAGAGNKLEAKAIADSQAIGDVTRAFMPDPGKALKDVIKDRTIKLANGDSISLVDEAIEVITGKKGRQITDKLRQWYVEEGWQKLLDPGGLKFGVPFTTWEARIGRQFGVMGPRSSGLFGLLAGNLISENLPLTDRIAQAAIHKTGIDKLLDKTIGAPFRAVRRAIDKHFRSTAGLSVDEKAILSQARGAPAAASDIVGNVGHTLANYVNVEELSDIAFRKGTLPAYKAAPLAKKISLGQQKMTYILGMNAMELGLDDAELPQYIASYIKKPDTGLKHAKEWGAPVSKKAIDEYTTMVKRIRKVFESTLEFEKRYGIEGGRIPHYFAVRSAEDAAELQLQYSAAVKAKRGKFPHQKHMKTFGLTYDDMMELPLGVGEGKIKMRPDVNLERVLVRRLVPSVQHALLSDTLENAARLGIAKHDILSAVPDDMFDPSAIKAVKREGPTELASVLAEAARGAKKGIPSKAVEDFFGKLKVAQTQDDVLKTMSELYLPNTLTDANVKDIMSQWNAVREEVKRNIGAGANRLEGKLTAMNQATTMLRSNLEAAKLGHNIDKLADQGKEVVDRAVRVNRLGKQVLKLAKKRDVERHVPALLEYLGGSSIEGGVKGIEDITEGTLGRIKHLLVGKSPKEELKKFLSPGKDLTRAGNALAGIKISTPGNPNVLMDGANLSISKPMLEEMARFTDFDKAVKNAGGIFLSSIDFVTRPLKKLLTGTLIPLPGKLGIPRPSFFGRNAIDLLFRRGIALSSVAGRYNIKNYRHAANIVLGLDGEIEAGGYKYAYREIRDFLKRRSLWHHTWGRADTQTKTAIETLFDEFNKGTRISYSKFRQSVEKVLGKKGIAALDPNLIGSGMENIAIVEGLLSQMGQNVPINHALDNLTNVFFDYSKLTDTEKVLSRVFLFYNFNRQAVPFALNVLNKHPFIYTSFGRLKEFGMSKKEEENLPKWVKDFPFFKLSRNGNMLEVASMRSTFTIDVLGETFPKDLDSFFGKLNPILLAPAEYVLGREFFMKRDIKKDKYLRQEMGDLAMNVFKPWTKARQLKDASGKSYWKVDGNRWYLLRRLWFSRIFRDLDSMARIYEGDTPFASGLLDLGLGLKIRQYDLEKQQKFLQDDAMRAKSAYKKALREGDRQRAEEILRDITL